MKLHDRSCGIALGTLERFNNGLEHKINDGSILGSDEGFDIGSVIGFIIGSRDGSNDISLDTSEVRRFKGSII